MADEEQVRILKQGPRAWNNWRHQDGWKTGSDLSEAHLAEADLSRANLLWG
jgi:hypothetical protein